MGDLILSNKPGKILQMGQIEALEICFDCRLAS